MAVKYPRVFRAWLGPALPTVYLVHPDPIKIILKSTQPKFTDHMATYHLLLPWLGKYFPLSCGVIHIKKY